MEEGTFPEAGDQGRSRYADGGGRGWGRNQTLGLSLEVYLSTGAVGWAV